MKYSWFGSIEPVLPERDAWPAAEEVDASASGECRCCGWTNSGSRFSEASLSEVASGSLKRMFGSSRADSLALSGMNERLSGSRRCDHRV